MGAKTGPRKLAAVNRASGTERWLDGQISVSEPPELVTIIDVVSSDDGILQLSLQRIIVRGTRTSRRAEESTQKAEDEQSRNIGRQGTTEIE